MLIRIHRIFDRFYSWVSKRLQPPRRLSGAKELPVLMTSAFVRNHTLESQGHEEAIFVDTG